MQGRRCGWFTKRFVVFEPVDGRWWITRVLTLEIHWPSALLVDWGVINTHLTYNDIPPHYVTIYSRAEVPSVVQSRSLKGAKP